MTPLLSRLLTALALLPLLAAPAIAQNAPSDVAEYQFGEAFRYDVVSGLTTSGEPYNPERLTVAHATLPFGTLVEVTFRNRSLTARVNDRDTGGGLVRLSARAADQLGLPPNGGIVELSLEAGEVAFLREQAARRDAAAGRTSPAEAPVPAATASSSYTIQLASFSDESQALRHASEGRGRWVQPATAEGRTVFRVYYGIYPSREAAGRALDVLRSDGLAGFVKGIAEHRDGSARLETSEDQPARNVASSVDEVAPLPPLSERQARTGVGREEATPSSAELSSASRNRSAEAAEARPGPRARPSESTPPARPEPPFDRPRGW